jgi:hypothetical protein
MTPDEKIETLQIALETVHEFIRGEAMSAEDKNDMRAVLNDLTENVFSVVDSALRNAGLAPKCSRVGRLDCPAENELRRRAHLKFIERRYPDNRTRRAA